MNEKIIKEVMGLVEGYGIEASFGDSSLLPARREAIRAKLHEMLERKPLTDEQIVLVELETLERAAVECGLVEDAYWHGDCAAAASACVEAVRALKRQY